MTDDPVRIAVVGAGLIGKRHVAAITAAEGAVVSAIVDPSDDARQFASGLGMPWFAGLGEMIASAATDGVILATPNQMHADQGLSLIAANLPCLIEKPIASNLDAARRLVDAAEARGIPLAVGHHRRHNPLVARAKALIDDGALGTLATVHGTTWFRKPDDYFNTEWRRKAGAGPVYLNLIHDIDLLHHFCGPITQVQAMDSSAIRGFEVEDTAVMILRFASGTLGTVTVCDTAVAPWSWELTARENAQYPATGQDCYWIGGTLGALSLPNLALWSQGEKQSWWESISSARQIHDFTDPLILQAEQFARVIRHGEAPLVSGRDGLAALAVIEAVKTAAATGAPVRISVVDRIAPA